LWTLWMQCKGLSQRAKSATLYVRRKRYKQRLSMWYAKDENSALYVCGECGEWRNQSLSMSDANDINKLRDTSLHNPTDRSTGRKPRSIGRSLGRGVDFKVWTEF